MTKAALFHELRLELSGLLTKDWLSNLSNFSAALYSRLPDLNWCGFYLVRQAARSRQLLRVDDVHAFPDHIACDARSRSEIVIPLVNDETVIGVLDLDSPTIARFDSEDEAGLRSLVDLLMEKTVWPREF